MRREKRLGEEITKVVALLCSFYFLISNLSLNAAVTLSIASTNDYRFTTPNTTNLVGKGMGPNASYVVTRAEDIAFLREAIAERENLLYGGRADSERVDLVTNGLAIASGGLSHTDFLGTYPFVAFAPSFGNLKLGTAAWRQCSAAFVADAFSPSVVRTQTGSDYLVNGKTTGNGDLSAFAASNSSSYVSRHLLSTNAYLRGPVRSSVVAGVYSNIVAGTQVIHCNQYDTTIGQTLEVKNFNITGFSERFSYVPYTYLDPQGNTLSDSYYTYNGLTEDDPMVWTNRSNVAIAPDLMTLSMYCDKTTRVPSSFRFCDRYQPKRCRAVRLDPYHYEEYFRRTSLESSGKIRCSGPFLSVATNYVTSANCFLVFRLAVVKKEELWGDTTEAYTTATTNHWVLSQKTTAQYDNASGTWELDFDIGQRLGGFFETGWVRAVSWPTVDILNPDYSDATTDFRIRKAYRSREISINGIDLCVYIYFKPTFRARITN